MHIKKNGQKTCSMRLLSDRGACLCKITLVMIRGGVVAPPPSVSRGVHRVVLGKGHWWQLALGLLGEKKAHAIPEIKYIISPRIPKHMKQVCPNKRGFAVSYENMYVHPNK